MTKIEELEQRLEVMEQVAKAYGIFKEEVEWLQKALAELKESKKEGKWKPAKDKWYWYIGSFGEVQQTCWENSESDEYIYKHQPIFKTIDECERYKLFMDTVKEKSYEFSKEEWEDVDIPKFIIKRNYEKDYFEVGCFQSIKYFNTTYFKTEEDAQYIIDNFKDELMEYWL